MSADQTNDAFAADGRYDGGDIECIDAMEAIATCYEDQAAGMLAAQALKYLWRAESKGRAADCDKAIDYTRRLRARLDGRPGEWDRGNTND